MMNEAQYDMRILPAKPLKDWIDRQKIRLEHNGTSWAEWCREKGIGETWYRNLYKRELVSYSEADKILTPAGFCPEDLYGWDELFRGTKLYLSMGLNGFLTIWIPSRYENVFFPVEFTSGPWAKYI